MVPKALGDHYASLLVHVETGSTSSDARLNLAASLAGRFKATLIGISAKAVRPPPVDTCRRERASSPVGATLTHGGASSC
jgi:hypothetical protein